MQLEILEIVPTLVLDLVPPSVPVMWLLTMGGGEGCHTVKVVVRPVQTRGLVWPLDTWQQGWSLLSPWVLGHTCLSQRNCRGFPHDLPLTVSHQS